MNIQNPHDKFFKETFGDVEVAKDFINNYVPKNITNIIDLSTLEPQKDSFINKELQEEFSDLLFRVNINDKEGYIYFLFEHKSYTSKSIAFQLLKYMINIWEAKIKKEGIRELPIIIPLVIYHGKDKWDIKNSLGEMIKGYNELPDDIKEYIPNFKYLIYDISEYTNEEIKGQAQLRIALTAFRNVFTKHGNDSQEPLFRAFEYLAKLEDKQTGIEYFETVIRYLFSTRMDITKDDVNEMVNKIENVYPEGSEIMMTLAEQFREEGMAEGIKKGIKEGETKILVKTATSLLTKKFGALEEDTRLKIEKLDTITLECIIDEIFEYESLDDLKRYIK